MISGVVYLMRIFKMFHGLMNNPVYIFTYNTNLFLLLVSLLVSLFRFIVYSIQPTFLSIFFIVATILPYDSYLWVIVNYPESCICKSAIFTHQTAATFFPLQCSVFLLIPLCQQFHHTWCLISCYETREAFLQHSFQIVQKLMKNKINLNDWNEIYFSG